MDILIKVLLFLVLSTPAWASFPTTGILDNCTRADESPINPTNWALAFGYSQALAISFDTCVKASGGYGAEYWQLNSFGPNIEAYGTIGTAPTGSKQIAFRIITSGVSTGSDNGYGLVLIGTAGGTLTLSKVTADSFSTLATYTQATSNGDSFGFSLSGSTLTTYYKVGAGAWTALGTVTDSTYSSSSSYITAEMTDSASLTNFGGGNIIGGSGNTVILNNANIKNAIIN